MAVGEALAGEAQALLGGVLVGEVLEGETSIGETAETSAGETLAGETSVGETSVGETLAADEPVEVGAAEVGASAASGVSATSIACVVAVKPVALAIRSTAGEPELVVCVMSTSVLIGIEPAGACVAASARGERCKGDKGGDEEAKEEAGDAKVREGDELERGDTGSSSREKDGLGSSSNFTRRLGSGAV